MKAATVADLRNNFATVSRWIYEGKSVAIHKRGRAFAILAPAASRKRESPAAWPDYEARMKRYCPEGFKGATGAEIVATMRGKY